MSILVSKVTNLKEKFKKTESTDKKRYLQFKAYLRCFWSPFISPPTLFLSLMQQLCKLDDAVISQILTTFLEANRNIPH